MALPLRRFTPQPKPLLRNVSRIVVPASPFTGPANSAFQCDTFQNNAFQLTPCPPVAPPVTAIRATQKRVAKPVKPQIVRPASAAPTVAATSLVATQKKTVKPVTPKLVRPATAAPTVRSTNVLSTQKRIAKPVAPKLVRPATVAPPPPPVPATVVAAVRQKPVKPVAPKLVRPSKAAPTVAATVVQGVRRPAPIRFRGSRLVVVAAPSQAPVHIGGGAVPYEPPYPYWQDRTPLKPRTPEHMATMLALYEAGAITEEEFTILVAS